MSGIRFDSTGDLPEWAQKQLLGKLKGQTSAPAPRNKYGAQRTEAHGIKFDSKKEARRFEELLLLLQSGKISDLRLQEQFTLQEAYTTPEGVRMRAIRFQADFTYLLPDGSKVVEDVKSRATMTRVYAIKKKMMADRFGIEVREVF